MSQRLVKSKKWNTEFLCRNFNQGIAGKTEQAGLWSLESRRDLEAKKIELDKTESGGIVRSVLKLTTHFAT